MLQSLYMFRALTTPIIRSIQNCNYSLRYRSYFLYSYLPSTWPSLAMFEGGSCTVPEAVVTVLCIPDDGCGCHPKHVEGTCRKINRLLCIFIIFIIIPCKMIKMQNNNNQLLALVSICYRDKI